MAMSRRWSWLLMISVQQLALRQGTFALHDISFTIPSGKYGVLMGKTGSGKTTILEALAGLRPIRAGRIVLGDCDVTAAAPACRGVGYVPQDAALFGSMTVRDNLAFALTLRRWPAQRIESRVTELSRWLGVETLLDRYPHGLSGGEAQRVALGRALAFHPAILLLDEPLSSLDDDTREALLDLLHSVKANGTATVLHVTHNRREADQLGDVRLCLVEGRIVAA
ncbi:MAG: ABC transporter ATP-binding protein [Gemmataceae bacterium]|nr:ABC transporter ATP-binding protein [Gemmataceae bacterium]